MARVAHDASDLPEGEAVVLTLQDAQILAPDGSLNEDGDVLEKPKKQRKEKQRKTGMEFWLGLAAAQEDTAADLEEDLSESVGGGSRRRGDDHASRSSRQLQYVCRSDATICP
ncbi:sart-1 family protein [Cyclospora cayetanensis]|uniref:Sart-1 family protein n=1 Tax=Cyclospora cayetanensis TaxID=88456 RepID=A0A1D3CRI4_9EIME|nr:sart-1 family protein [Cyclospora cayetanensis]